MLHFATLAKKSDSKVTKSRDSPETVQRQSTDSQETVHRPPIDSPETVQLPPTWASSNARVTSELSKVWQSTNQPCKYRAVRIFQSMVFRLVKSGVRQLQHDYWASKVPDSLVSGPENPTVITNNKWLWTLVMQGSTLSTTKDLTYVFTLSELNSLC